jgi:cytochrome c
LSKKIIHDHNNDGVDRRGFLECMAWAGTCHALDRDQEGPQLHGVYGRKAASVESFQYSDALKNSKIVWTDETLERWLTDTEKLVPNNDMTFHVEKAEERRAIIAYLKHDSGK